MGSKDTQHGKEKQFYSSAPAGRGCCSDSCSRCSIAPNTLPGGSLLLLTARNKTSCAASTKSCPGARIMLHLPAPVGGTLDSH